jgi:hypothetical protein
MPLLMPFYFDYDLLLLSIPAVLFAGEVMMRAPGARLERDDRLLLFAWAALYAWTMVNAELARLSEMNVTVVWLATAAALLTRRAARTAEPAGTWATRQPDVLPAVARRAA